MSIWSADELARFLAHVASDRLYPLLRLAAFTGMRRSELLGLKWSERLVLEAPYLPAIRGRIRGARRLNDRVVASHWWLSKRNSCVRASTLRPCQPTQRPNSTTAR